jgi:hypothetical protein
MRRSHRSLIILTALATSAAGLAPTTKAAETRPAKKAGFPFKVTLLKGKATHATSHASPRQGQKDAASVARIAPLRKEEKRKLVSLTVDSGPTSTKALGSKTLTITDDWWAEPKASLWAHCPEYVDSHRLAFASRTDGEGIHLSLYPAGNKALTAKHFAVDFKIILLAKTAAEYKLDFPESHSSHNVSVPPGLHHLTVAGKIADISKGATFILTCTSPQWVQKGNTKEFCGVAWDFDGCEVMFFD